MSKQTAVEFLIQHIEIALKMNNVKINFGYRINTINPIYEQAKAMEREQIEQAFVDGVDSGLLSDADNYYTETYKGGEQ